MNENKLIEICVDSIESAIIATKARANRLEVCRNINQGGTTPNLGLVKTIIKNCNILVNVLIRPRAGNFVYSMLEKEEILADIKDFTQLGVNAIVVGCLTTNNKIDIEFLQQIIKVANGIKITFHRAFDLCQNPFTALQTLIDFKINTVLTSGQKQTAIEGHQLIKKLLEKANGKINILAGSGIRHHNIKNLYNLTHINQIHATAFTKVKIGKSNNNCTMGKNDDNAYVNRTDFDKVKQLVDNFRS